MEKKRREGEKNKKREKEEIKDGSRNKTLKDKRKHNETDAFFCTKSEMKTWFPPINAINGFPTC